MSEIVNPLETVTDIETIDNSNEQEVIQDDISNDVIPPIDSKPKQKVKTFTTIPTNPDETPEVWDIPIDEVDGFLKNPNTPKNIEEVQTFNVNGELYDIPNSKAYDFLKKNKNAVAVNYDFGKKPQAPQQPLSTFQDNKQTVVPQQPQTEIKEPRKRTKSEIKNSFNLPEDGSIFGKPSSIYENINTTFQTPDGRTINLWDDKYGVSITTPDGITRPFNVNADMQSVPEDQRGNLMRFISIQQNVVKQNNERAKVYYTKLADEGNMTPDEKMQYAKIFGSQYLNNTKGDAYTNLQQSYSDLEKSLPYYVEKGLNPKWDEKKQRQFIQQIQEQDAVTGREVYPNPFDLKTTYETSKGRIRNSVEEYKKLHENLKTKKTEVEQEIQTLNAELKKWGNMPFETKGRDAKMIEINNKLKNAYSLVESITYTRGSIAKSIMDIENYINKPTEEGANAVWHELKNMDLSNMLLVGFATPLRDVPTLQIAKKKASGVPLSEDEEFALELYRLNEVVKSSIPSTSSGNITSSLLETIPHMLNLALTRGSGTVIKVAAEKYLSKYISSNLLNKAIGTALMATFQGALMGNTYGDAVEATINNPETSVWYNYLKEIPSNAASAWIETRLIPLASNLSKMTTKEIGSLYAQSLRKSFTGKIDDVISKSLGSTGELNILNGLGGEFGEEKADQFKSILLGEDSWRNFFSLRSNLETFAVVALMQGGGKIYKKGIQGVDVLNSRKEYLKTMSQLPELFKDSLITAMNQTTPQAQQEAFSKIPLEQVNNIEDRRKIVEFLNAKFSYDFAKGALQGKQQLDVAEGTVQQAMDYAQGIENADGNIVVISDKKTGKKYISKAFNKETGMHIAIPYDGSEIVALSETNVDIIETIPTIEFAQAIVQNKLEEVKLAQQQQEAVQDMEDVQMASDVMQQQGGSYDVGDQVTINGKQATITGANDGRGNFMVTIETPDGIGESYIANQSMFDSEVTEQPLPETEISAEIQTTDNQEQSQEVAPSGDNVSTQPQSINTEATDVNTQPTPDIPRLKDGSPDFDSMQPEMLGVELEKQFGNDRAKTILRNQIKNQREALKRLDKKQAKTINEEAKNDTEKNKIKDNIKRLEISLMNLTKSNVPMMQKREQPKQKVVSSDIQQIRDVYQSSPKVYGRSKQMTLPNGEKVKGRYVLIEAGSAVPSHDPFTFAKTKGFPTTETGTTVNDRDYEKDKKAQGEVILQSQKLDDRAYYNPVMITSDGIVVSGNQRTMTRIRAVQQGADVDYTTTLREDIDMFGISQEQFDGFNNPQLVFELNETPDYTTATFAKFNTEDKKSQSTTESAVKVSKTIKPDTISKIGDILDKHETLGDFYSDNQAISEVLTILQTDGVIRGNDIARLVKSDGVGLSDSGKEFFETLLIGTVLNESAIRQIDVEGMRNIKQKIVKAIVPIVNNAKLKEYNLIAEISEAINIVEQARKNKLSVANFISNGTIFDKSNYSDAGVFFAVLLDNSKESQFRNAIVNYNANAILAESGQVDIFSGDVTTKEQILETLIQNADAETKQIQQKAWDAVKQNRDANAFFTRGTTTTGNTDVAETPTVKEATSEVKESVFPTPETPTETKQRQKEVVADALGIESQRIAEVETMLNELSIKTKKQAKTTVVRSNADAIVQMKKDKVDTVFIQAFQDVVANGHKPEAIMTNAGLYIVSSNIKNTQRAFEVWMHEQAGHYGIRLIMPDIAQRKAFFTDIYNSVGEANIREVLGDGYANVTKPETLGEEYFGRVCEKVARETSLNELEQGVWDKFLTKLREFISNILPSAKLSQGQIESIAKASIQNIIEVRKKTDIQARQKTAEIEAKTDSVNTNPTEAQKEAGNYTKAKVSIQGLQITIENPKGSVRSGTDKDGNEWFIELNNDYGYFNGTNGKDGDQIDVFIGNNPTSKKVFVVDQVDTDTREFDESKVMLGFDTIEEAEQNYLLNYEAGWQGLGKITEVDIDTFKTWLNDGKRQLKPFGEYKEFKKETPMFSIAQKVSPIGFYSTVENSLNQISQNKGTAEQFKAMLLKNGAKQAELDWMDYDGTFTGNSITKSDIQNWIDKNRIEVEEVTKEYEKELRAVESARNGVWMIYKGGEFVYTGIEADNAEEAIIKYKKIEPKLIGENLPKYSQYQLPGGENYKEVLLTMPVPTQLSKIEKEELSNLESIKAMDRTPKQNNRMQELYDKIPEANKNTFKSSHFDEPNILAHVRFNERNVNGEKVLFIEELQSDWQQSGREKGFKGDTTYDAVLEKENVWDVGGIKVLYFERGVDGKNYRTINKNREQVWFKTLDDAVKQANETVSNTNEKEIFKVPDMPFKKTDQWVNLAMRRMMKYAVDNGFDRIAWTNGEQQVKRYENLLREQVDTIYWQKEKNGTITVMAFKNGGKKYEQNYKDAASTEADLGKEISAQIQESIDKGENENEIKGNDLKVGGAGMKAFYDAIVPSAVNKLVKPFGTKTEVITLQEGTEQLSVPINEAMIETVSGGVPMFSISPADKNKVIDQVVNDKSLIAVHNISINGIGNAIKLGGLAQPSIAVINKNNPFTKYGEITLVMDKNTIDPRKNSKVNMFGADVYSPRYPSATYVIPQKSVYNIIGKYGENIKNDEIKRDFTNRIREDIERNGKRDLRNNGYMAMAFLDKIGKKYKTEYRKQDTPDAIIKAFQKSYLSKRSDYSNLFVNEKAMQDIETLYLQEVNIKYSTLPDLLEDLTNEWKAKNNDQKNMALRYFFDRVNKEAKRGKQVDGWGTFKNAKEVVNSNSKLKQQFEEEVNSFYESLNVEEKIFKGYTNRGRKYVPYTLENVMKEKKAEGIRAGEGFGYGLPSIRAKATPLFKSLAEVSKNKDRIISPELFEESKKAMQEYLNNISEAVQPYYKYDRYDDNALIDDINSLVNRGKSESFNQLPADIQQQVKDFYEALKEMPTEYFEAVITKIVDLSEFSNAIVPKDTPKQVVDYLTQRGVKVSTYKDGKRHEALVKVAESQPDVLFSIAPTSSVEEKLSRLTPNQRKQAEQGISKINESISNVETSIASIKKQIDSKRKSINERMAKDSQMDMFESEKPKDEYMDLMADIFAPDLSEKRKVEVLKPLQKQLQALQTQYNDLVKQRRDKVNQAITQAKAQLEMDFDAMFSIAPTKEYKPIPKQYYDKLLTRLNKAFPNVSISIDTAEMERVLNTVEGRKQMLTVWHGSPHSFDKFSTDYMGTGEGIQAYGWGLYFTDKKSIAEDYANKLKNQPSKAIFDYFNSNNINISKNGISTKTLDNSFVNNYFGNKELSVDQAIKYINSHDPKGNTINILNKLKELGIKTLNDIPSTNIYTVELHKGKSPDEYDYLRWDKPVTEEQKKKIKAQFEKDGIMSKFDNVLFSNSTSNMYMNLSGVMKGTKEASLFLLRAGIDGIKYPAEYLSKGSHEDAFNYVVFDENAITIDSKIQFLTTPTGELYGMTHMGKIYLDGNKMNANAPIHEYGHIWADIAKKQYPEVYNHGLELIKGTEYETEVRNSGSYKNLKDDEQILNEALVTAIGDRGEQIVDKAIRNKFVSWLKDLFNNIRMRLGINRVADLSKFDLSKMDLTEFVKRVNLDLLGGVPISYMSSSDVAKRDANKLIIGIKGATRLDEINEATIRVDNLKVAEEMEKADKSPTEIRLATGWERGADNMWRYEVEDMETTEKFNNLDVRNKAIKLSEAINNTELFNAYPELKDVKVKITASKEYSGEWDKTNNTISLSTYINAKENYNEKAINEAFKSSLIHEIQHAIQDIEGFAKGGDAETYKKNVNVLNNQIDELQQFIKDEENDTRDWLEVNNKLQELTGDESNFDELFDKYDTELRRIEEETGLKWHRQRLQELYDKLKDSDGTVTYQRLAGEVEARNASTRMNFTPEQRILQTLASTEDISRADQIILHDTVSDTPMFSISNEPPLLAPNGKPSNLNKKQYEQVRTKEFKAWFGDWENDPENASKVVDENGEPMVVYHGTSDKIEEFNDSYAGDTTGNNEHGAFFFANKKDIAEDYSRQSYIRRYEGRDIDELISSYGFSKKEAKNIINDLNDMAEQQIKTVDSYLNIKNPIIIDNKYRVTPVLDIQELINFAKNGVYSDVVNDYINELEKFNENDILDYKDEIEQKARENYDLEEDDYIENYMLEDATREVLEENGIYPETQTFDGIIIKNTIDDISDKSVGIQDTVIAFSPTQIKSATSNTGTFDPNNPDIRFSIAPKELQDETKMVTRTKDIVREIMQDRLLSVKMLQDYVVSKGGTLTNATDTKSAVERYSSKVNGRFRLFNMQVLRPLTKFIADIEKRYKLDSYATRDYLLAKASLARHNAGTSALSEDLNDEWNIEAVKKIITDYEIKVDASDVAELWDKTNAVNDFSMKALKDAGIITKEQYDNIKAKWDYYIPLRGWDLPDEVNKQIELYTEMDKQGVARTGDTTYTEALKKAKGRKSKAYDPISTMSNIAYSSLITAEKNIAEQTMLNFIRQNKDFIEDVAFVKRTWIVKSEDGTKETEVIERPDQSLFDAGRVKNKRNKDTREFSKYVTPQSQQAKQIEVYENGIKYVIEFKQSGVAEAIRGTNMFKMPKFWDVVMGKPTRFLSANLTGLNPDFIPVNFIRDFGYAMLTNYVNANSKISNMGIINEIGQASKAIKAFSWDDNFDETNPLHKDFINFINNGGATGYVNMQKLEKVKKQIDRDLKVLAGSESKFEKTTRYAKAPFAQATRAIGFLGDMSEITMRYAVYRAGIKAGLSVNEAVDMAKNITVNFNRKGRISGVLGSLYAFYNAALQGGNNFITLAYQNKGKMAKVALSFMAMGALWNVAMTMLMGGNPDDDESYYNVNEFSRYNNLIIPTGGKNYIKIPLPHVFRSFFAMGQIGVEMMTGHKSFGQGLLGSMDAMLDGLSPVNLDLMSLEGDYAGSTFMRTLMPTTIQPIWDLGFNRNFFGETITKESFDKSTPSSQLGKTNVSPVLRTMAETFNAWSGGDKFKSGAVDINPSAIEYLFESYTAGRGRFYLNLVKLGQHGFKMAYYGSDDSMVLDTKNIPIANRFVGQNRGADWGGELKEMTKTVKDDNDLMRKYYKNMDESDDYKQKYEAIVDKYDGDIVWTRGTSRNQPTPNLQAMKIIDKHSEDTKLIYDDINSSKSQVERQRLYDIVKSMSKETVQKLRVYKIKQ